MEILGFGIRTLDIFAGFPQTGPEPLLEHGAKYPLPQPPGEIPNLLLTHLTPIYHPNTVQVLGLMGEVARVLLPIGLQAG